jgi:hypothetical protein
VEIDAPETLGMKVFNPIPVLGPVGIVKNYYSIISQAHRG